MTSGIFGGDIRQLSVRSCFGRLFEKEQEHGSILKSMLFHSTPPVSKLYDGTPKSDFVQEFEKAMSVSFRGGMQTLTDALATNFEVTDIARS